MLLNRLPERAAVFGGDYVNVPASRGRAQADAAALMAMANVGDSDPACPRPTAATLTACARISGKHYRRIAYEVDRETMRIEPEKVREGCSFRRTPARDHRRLVGSPALRLQAFRVTSQTRLAQLPADMLTCQPFVAAGLHPNPSFADVTTTVHKTGRASFRMILSSRGKQRARNHHRCSLASRAAPPCT